MLLSICTKAPANKKSVCQNLHPKKKILRGILECIEWFNYELKWLCLRKNTFAFFLVMRRCPALPNEKTTHPFFSAYFTDIPPMLSYFEVGRGWFGVFVGIIKL